VGNDLVAWRDKFLVVSSHAVVLHQKGFSPVMSQILRRPRTSLSLLVAVVAVLLGVSAAPAHADIGDLYPIPRKGNCPYGTVVVNPHNGSITHCIKEKLP
jgi:hypothetical protein